MKKIAFLFLTTTFIGITNTAKAQDEPCFKVGASAINLGIGFGNTVNYDNGLGVYGINNSGMHRSPTFTASYEYGIAHLGIGIIGAGLEFGYQGSHYDYSGTTYKDVWTTLAFSPRATYHFDILNKKKFDVYPIIQINIYDYIYSNNYSSTVSGLYNNNSNNSGIGVRPSILVAARYFFTPNIGVYSELGYDICIIKAGLSIKFGGK